jgi:exodeoxyribonuclease-3
MKIATWNVNGIRARQAQMQEFLDSEQPDVLCLQELKASIDQLPAWLCDIEGYWCYWHGGPGYSGVSLHVRKATFPDRPTFTHPDFDFEHRIVVAELPAFSVASVYVPNGGKDFPAKMRFMEALTAFVAEHGASGRPLVLCGDMNIAPTEIDVHPKERKPGGIGQRSEERDLFARMSAHGLIDVHRKMEPDNADLFTWWAPWRNMRQRNIGWRLDFILASRTIADGTLSCVVRREFGTSDHGPVIAVFRPPPAS